MEKQVNLDIKSYRNDGIKVEAITVGGDHEYTAIIALKNTDNQILFHGLVNLYALYLDKDKSPDKELTQFLLNRKNLTASQIYNELEDIGIDQSKIFSDSLKAIYAELHDPKITAGMSPEIIKIAKKELESFMPSELYPVMTRIFLNKASDRDIALISYYRQQGHLPGEDPKGDDPYIPEF